MEFFKKRTGAYYFGLIVAVFSVVTAFIYRNVFGDTSFMSDVAFYLIIGAGVSYVVVSTLGACNFAAAIMTGLNFAGFCVYVRYVYEYLTETVIGGIDWSDKGFIGFVTVTACMLVCCLLSNILAWSKMEKGENKARSRKKASKKCDEESIIEVGEGETYSTYRVYVFHEDNEED